ncbi:hypothetical protein GALL_537170 [mine drainage metagenome]|uniref:Uncharacterized protein n=1 Tax=mine drainage metagenome TaxID=410659 RepID=A0A1J5PHH6_9ZZZZ
MLPGDVSQCTDPGRIVVEAGDVVELLATGVQKRGAAFLVDFFEGFQAVAGEGRADHVNPCYAGLAHFNQRWLGVGLQPLGAAQA